ncbi:hypothetical protein CPC08DRAFT_747616 [Agrocybe pediades]|nr:hypothetical protein CPC08DRAFT_747616 [Agrocybe pediades]
MGLLKRLFSLGSKKGKKERPPIVHNVPLPDQSWVVETPANAVNEEEHEAAVGRLLRSSSARYVEHATIDYTNLPPLPHPINKVLQTAASSTVSVDTASLIRRGTYNVTVHKRRRHTSTEFENPDAEPAAKAPTTSERKRTSLHPVEDSRVLRLRSDPSVASLIDLYDAHGKVSNDAFSNSPPSTPKDAPLTEGRAQVKRNGSTLHQLLGAPSSSGSRDGDESGSVEGDISWAERFLAETEAMSSNSSLALQTPSAPFAAELPEPEVSFITDGDASNVTYDNPAISSMEVELSIGADISKEMDELARKSNNNPYGNSNPSTPQRASQIFGFLTKGKQSKPPTADLDRALPDLPSCFSSPSDENASREYFEPPLPADLANFQFNPARFSVMPMPLLDETPRKPRPHSVQVEGSPPFTDSNEPRSAFSDDSHDVPCYAPKESFLAPETPAPSIQTSREDKQNAIKVLLNGQTKVIVTAPTPGTGQGGPARLRGPRAPPRRSSLNRRSALVEVSNSPPTSPVDACYAPSKRKPRSRSGSQSSNRSSRSYDKPRSENQNWNDASKSSSSNRKENHLALSVKTELPSTPLRSNHGSRSLLRTVVQQAMFRPPQDNVPSPASSSDMSPMGRQMMADVREQRMRARELDRARSGSRFATKI